MPRNFICRGCGREVFVFEESEPPQDLCIHCETMPGWRDDPALRALLDPGGRFAAPQTRAAAATNIEAQR